MLTKLAPHTDGTYLCPKCGTRNCFKRRHQRAIREHLAERAALWAVNPPPVMPEPKDGILKVMDGDKE